MAPSPQSPTPLARAGGLELWGEQQSSGHRRAPLLVKRADGQVIQMTSLLYRVLEAIDGRSDYRAIASAVSAQTGRNATAEDVRLLTESKLRPLGVLDEPARKSLPRANPLLGVRGRMVIISPSVTHRLARPFARLFWPPVVLCVLGLFGLSTAWVLFHHGLGGPVREAIYQPGHLLAVMALTAASAGFHEFGHAAACQYGGARPGVIGAGVYLVWPAFYTDVTDSYRLDRRGRLRVDLGGLYFNAVFAVAITGVWWVTGWDAVLIVVPLQLMQMLRQLGPYVRLDGYHILADLVGVPDLFAHVKPTLLGLLPTRWGRPESKTLRPWARAVVAIWVLLVVPLLLVSLAEAILLFPRLAGTGWDSLRLQWGGFHRAWGDADLAEAMVRLVSMFTLLLPILCVPYIVYRVARRAGRTFWRATDGRPVVRGLAVVVAGGLLSTLAAVWWPDGQYRPIDQSERGRIQDALTVELASVAPVAFEGAAPVPAATATNAQRVIAPPSARPPASPTRQPPVADEPVDPRAGPPWRPPWGVRFNPPVPEEGDNFAIALNTSDRTTVIALAFSIVQAMESPVDNSNRAYALANCVECAAIAVAFQIVLILAEVEAIIPDNVAVALTGSCVECVTYALAVQLVVSVVAPLSDEAQDRIGEAWRELEDIANGLGTTVAISELQDRLLSVEAAVLQVLIDEGAVIVPGSTGDANDPSGPDPATPDAGDQSTTTTEPTSTEGTTPEPTTTEPAEPTESTTTTSPAEDSTTTSTTAPETTTTSEPVTTTTTEPPP